MVVVLTGAAGAGKTTVGRALAASLRWPFRDADELHAPAAVEKMRHGEPLTDDDRWPWLARVRAVIANAILDGTSMVVACSALRARYRNFLTEGLPEGVRFVHLNVHRELLIDRLDRRASHFAHADLVDSQLATLERPSDALVLDGSQPVPELVETIRNSLGL